MSKSDDWQHVGKVKFKTKSEQEKAFKKMPKVKDLGKYENVIPMRGPVA